MPFRCNADSDTFRSSERCSPQCWCLPWSVEMSVRGALRRMQHTRYPRSALTNTSNGRLCVAPCAGGTTCSQYTLVQVDPIQNDAITRSPQPTPVWRTPSCSTVHPHTSPKGAPLPRSSLYPPTAHLRRTLCAVWPRWRTGSTFGHRAVRQFAHTRRHSTDVSGSGRRSGACRHESSSRPKQEAARWSAGESGRGAGGRERGRWKRWWLARGAPG
eukprot:ctg_586.g299